MRHIKDYWFLNSNLPYDRNLTIDENFKNVGGEIIKMKKKKRYVIFLGNKREKKDMLKNLLWDILPYDKGNNKRYNTEFKTVNQMSLF